MHRKTSPWCRFYNKLMECDNRFDAADGIGHRTSMNKNTEQGIWAAIKGFFYPTQSQVFDKRRPYRFLMLGIFFGLIMAALFGLVLYYFDRPGPH